MLKNKKYSVLPIGFTYYENFMFNNLCVLTKGANRQYLIEKRPPKESVDLMIVNLELESVVSEWVKMRYKSQLPITVFVGNDEKQYEEFERFLRLKCNDEVKTSFIKKPITSRRLLSYLNSLDIRIDKGKSLKNHMVPIEQIMPQAASV